MNASEQSMEGVVAEADYVRARLLHTVEELDRRGHEAINLPLQLRRHAYEIGVAGGVGILILGIEQFLTHRRASRAARRHRRWEVLAQLWDDPDRVLRSQKRPFLLDALRSVAIGLITSLATAPARRAVAGLIGPPDGGSPARTAR